MHNTKNLIRFLRAIYEQHFYRFKHDFDKNL